MRQFNFNRPTRPYQSLYNLLVAMFNEEVPPKFKAYDDIDWTRLGSHTVMIRLNELVKNTEPPVYDLIIHHKSAELSDQKIEDLKSLFFFLARLQSETDLLEEIKGGS